MLNIYDYIKAVDQIKRDEKIKGTLVSIGILPSKREGDWVYPEEIVHEYIQYRLNLKKRIDLP